MLVVDKLELLKGDPFKYFREKLGKDTYGNQMFSIEVTGDIRILYSVDSKKLHNLYLGDWVSQEGLRSGLSS
jgi:hypothetical protein